MDWIKILEPLRFSISAHNSQPFKLEIDDMQLKVWIDEKRKLPVADPHQRDLLMSLGAFLSTLDIVLQSQDVQIQTTKLNLPPVENQPLATLQVQPSSGLSRAPSSQRRIDLLKKRFSYRGPFKKQEIDPVTEPGLKMFGIHFSTQAEVKSAVAKLFDKTNLATLARKEYLTELYSWMRFSKEHSQWSEDGLNAESINVSGIEAWGASLVLKPSVFAVLNSIGLGGVLISEKAQICSAHFIVAFSASASHDFVTQGKLFFEQWLNLTELGLFGAPLSLLTEHESTANEVKRLLQIPTEKTLVNVLRCGFLPEGYQRYAPARLDISKIIQLRS